MHINTQSAIKYNKVTICLKKDNLEFSFMKQKILKNAKSQLDAQFKTLSLILTDVKTIIHGYKNIIQKIQDVPSFETSRETIKFLCTKEEENLIIYHR